METITFPNRWRIVIPAFLCAAAWALLALLIALWLVIAIASYLGFGVRLGAFWNGLTVAFLATAAIYVLSGAIARCISCKRLIYFEGFRAKHPSFRRYRGLNCFSTTVVNVLRRRPFQCMYCGTAFTLAEHAS
jgi:hypothetical protein